MNIAQGLLLTDATGRPVVNGDGRLAVYMDAGDAEAECNRRNDVVRAAHSEIKGRPYTLTPIDVVGVDA